MSNPPIKLLVTDIDGCLIAGEKAPYDFDALAAIRELNRAARPDNAIPYVTICSGRPYPYVEAMIKLVDGQLPGIFEHGCGLYFPQHELRHECSYDPRALVDGPDRQRRDELIARIVAETGAGRQFAKGALVTLFPPPEHSPADFAAYVSGLLVEAGLPLEVGHTFTSVDIGPRGVDKGTGLRWLLEELRAGGWAVDLDQVAAVGDSTSDLPFMEIAGFSGAPANAAPPVRAAAGYVSPKPYTQGVLDILLQVVERNGGRA